jgi:hypothetical protein
MLILDNVMSIMNKNYVVYLFNKQSARFKTFFLLYECIANPPPPLRQ